MNATCKERRYTTSGCLLIGVVVGVILLAGGIGPDAQAADTIGSLPQLADVEGHGGHSGINAAQFVKPMGLTTLVMLSATALAGFFRRRKPAVLLRWHKRLAVLTLACGAAHAFLVLIFH